MDITAEEYLEKNTEYTGNEYDVFHIIDIAKFMNDFASIKTKELEEENKNLLEMLKEAISYIDDKELRKSFLTELD